ncbi:MAG TPA: GWxTD domain-containing protein [Acidobacteriota bacterium]|nr:GWxTD domain-containing protein [Acidobacteriota bacterium]
MTRHNTARASVALTVLAAVLAALTCTTAHAVEAVGDIRLWTDYAVYRMGEGSPNGYVEFYMEMKRADFEFRIVDDVIRADVHTWVRVIDTAGAGVDSIGGAFVATVRDSSELDDIDFTVFFARTLELPPGEYQARVVVTDLVDKTSAETRFPVSVQDFSRTELHLSDIELGYDILEVPQDSTSFLRDVLIKNGYKVYPDCRALVGVSRPRLFLYLEAYNLDFDPGRDNAYTTEFSIIPTDGSAAQSFGSQTLTKPGRSAVLATSVPVRDLAAGLYQVRAELTDPITQQTVWVEKSFQVVNPPADSLTEEETDRLRDIIAYIARPGEINAFEGLSAVGKRNFMIRFWKDRDPTPGTPENEFRDEHLRRMNLANDRFSVGFRDRSDGWRSDRGRVYIVYGPPDQVERSPFTPDRPPAEQWSYDNLPQQGQAYFLFLDEGGFGDYRLVHSSARGERRDPYWESQIRQGVFDRVR